MRALGGPRPPAADVRHYENHGGAARHLSNTPVSGQHPIFIGTVSPRTGAGPDVSLPLTSRPEPEIRRLAQFAAWNSRENGSARFRVDGLNPAMGRRSATPIRAPDQARQAWGEFHKPDGTRLDGLGLT